MGLCYDSPAQKMALEYDLEAMMRLFLKLDINHDGKVTAQEFVKAHTEHNVSEKHCLQFMEKFDRSGDGVVTLEEFSLKLGIPLKEATRLRYALLREANNEVDAIPEGVTVEAGNLPRDYQLGIIRAYVDCVKQHPGDPKALEVFAEDQKAELEKEHGGSWHILIAAGSFTARYSYVPLYMIKFSYEDSKVIAWRTPK